ncbi:U2 small nuclear ribonucleoprotein A' [Rhizophlyctis rosea]|uniref:U2 small nuclear ribonucleoprotein A' n=1 Tax=Rhizophlyctis rosea TaxID=64517 RepID=A0AAD5X6Z4_9FUNG|nr:U2 small nuclear ribonucleoprotein A' [Rhizophlyctis rosea]
MVKLNHDVLVLASSSLNAIKDRELELRSLKIPRIENLAITKDQHDTIDLSDNDIRKLENFPPMPRLKTLLLSNNRITRIDADCAKQLPNLHTLILTNNSIGELGDLDPLGEFANLEYLTLMDNPVTTRKYYRLYVIHRCPKVRVLDFRRVREAERTEAHEVFSGADGTALAARLSAQKSINTFEPGDLGEKKAARPYQAPSQEEQKKIRDAIAGAKSLDEITRLEKSLRTGMVPGQGGKRKDRDD